jgi:hypothetical protein
VGWRNEAVLMWLLLTLFLLVVLFLAMWRTS